uniref:Uncharacterized protein n=1 Tax=Craspedostauros australis TaxID=1486917 RepID=A0A7R9WVH1_9STRA|mmetsp:Transcript_20380/g.56712  ORF Transcript_20380/g.56712 Transcript_20380/m.56712 type:complete len:307 (+) Transcript_20380:231-1151(+)|eukprot:CAMPEP_0198131650 /NCGR_PEP_ID=MMETSP1442-20131203/56650_1 /TAXON_ID= /ORGANISM="Craspedostauros australis, Strain CCMP3328" /LENGTH=306 /DNA_ID=CAMNT_0043792505 /DNA_START=212 /DNA_END=1132 /DNA_ORIENTATION=-
MDFFVACRSGDLDLVRGFLESEESKLTLDMTISRGYAPLHIACLNNHTKLAKYLMESGARINVPNDYGNTPFHIVCAEGQLELVKFMVETDDADVLATNDHGKTPLHLAAARGHSEVLQYLFESDRLTINANAQNAAGNTVFHNTHPKCTMHHVIDDMTKLSNLYIFLRTRMVSQTNLDDAGTDHANMLINWAQPHADVQNRYGDTVLHVLCRRQSLHKIDWLIGSESADATLQNDDGDTVIHEICRRGELGTLETLVKHSRVTIDFNIRNSFGETALSIAEKKGYRTIVTFLKKIASTNAMDVDE